jgi:hypothetical protein
MAVVTAALSATTSSELQHLIAAPKGEDSDC